jgi:hypothetical protein
MDDAWDTEDSDIDIDNNEEPPSTFDGLTKGFLLAKPTCRNREPTPQRSQSEQSSQRTLNTPEIQAKRSIKEEVIQEIGHLKGTYGPFSGEDATSVPYSELAGLFHKIELWIVQTCQEDVSNAYERVEKAAKRIEEVADKIQHTKPTSYAQVARMEGPRATQGVAWNAPQKMHPKEEKRIIVKIPNKSEAQAIKDQSKEEIVARIQRVVGEKTANHTVLAVRQLRSGDLLVHMDSSAGKKELETRTGWAESIAPSAVVRKRTWPVIVHGVRVRDHQLDVWGKHAKRIEKENTRQIPNLKIQGMRWLRRTNKGDFAPLIIEVDSAEQANRLINEGVVIGFDLKSVERYDASCRITQCFKCQKYGHISTICANAEKCGHCGSDHTTEKCAGVSPATRKRCAACQSGEHTSWSAECPARVKETLRAKTAKLTLPKLFPISTAVPTLREMFGAAPAENTRLSGNSQATATENWSTVTTKKRKLQTPGRPTGAVSKAKTTTRDANQSIFNFSSQTQQQSTRGASDAPASTQPDKSSRMDCDSTLPIQEI